MTKSFDSTLLTALAAETCSPYYAAIFYFDSGTVGLWTGVGDKVIDGVTCIGAGHLLTFSGLGEVNDMSAKAITISLDGIGSNPDMLTKAFTEPYQRRRCRMFIGEESVSAVGEVFTGRINTMTVDDDGTTSTISVSVSSKMEEAERARDWRYTDESHQQRYDGDIFFSFVQSLQDQQLEWGPG